MNPCSRRVLLPPTPKGLLKYLAVFCPERISFRQAAYAPGPGNVRLIFQLARRQQLTQVGSSFRCLAYLKFNRSLIVIC